MTLRMPDVLQRRAPLLFASALALSAALALGCSGGNGAGETQDKQGGESGSASTGGAGGQNNGGSAQEGGVGGSQAGGSAGIANTGSGGQAGSAGGGSGGSAGQGGSPSASAGAAFFSGATMDISVMHAGDAMPGFVYNTVSEVPNVPKVVSVSDPALPAYVKYSFLLDAPATDTPFAWIFGINFRANSAPMAWQFYDASSFAALSVWVKAENPKPFRAVAYNINSLPKSEGVSTTTCTGATRAECGASAEAVMALAPSDHGKWKRFIFLLDPTVARSFRPSPPNKPFDWKTIGRVDFITGHNPGLKMWFTDIRFLSQNELPK